MNDSVWNSEMSDTDGIRDAASESINRSESAAIHHHERMPSRPEKARFLSFVRWYVLNRWLVDSKKMTSPIDRPNSDSESGTIASQ